MLALSNMSQYEIIAHSTADSIWLRSFITVIVEEWLRTKTTPTTKRVDKGDLRRSVQIRTVQQRVRNKMSENE